MFRYFLSLAYSLFLLSAVAIDDAVDHREIFDNLEKRLARVERVFNVSTLNPELDDMSYLEVFWEDAKRLAVNFIPPSDKECKFDLFSFSCQPKCSCTFRYQLGDYSLSRSCRLREIQAIGCADSDGVAKSIPKSEKLLILSSITSYISSKQPATDIECTWDFAHFRCEPFEICGIQWKPGDLFDLNRACRLRSSSSAPFEKNIDTEIQDPLNSHLKVDYLEDNSDTDDEYSEYFDEYSEENFYDQVVEEQDSPQIQTPATFDESTEEEVSSEFSEGVPDNGEKFEAEPNNEADISDSEEL